MRTRTLISILAASTALACSSGSDEDTSGSDGAADSASESQTSDVGHDGDAGASDTHAGDTHAGDTSGSDTRGDTNVDSTIGDGIAPGDSATGTDTTWIPDGDCDLPPAPIVDCSAATGPRTCSGPPPTFDPSASYLVGCTAIIPEASGTSCGPLHCTCTDLGAAGTGWECG